MRIRMLALLCLVGCASQPQYMYHGQDTVLVFVPESDWTPEQRTEILTALHGLEHPLKLTLKEVSETDANVVVRRAPGKCLDWWGWSVFGTQNVYVKPQCLSSTAHLRRIAVHEFGHWLGMMHLPETQNGMMLPGPTTDTPTTDDLVEFHRATGR